MRDVKELAEEKVKEAAERMAKTYRENYGDGKDILMPSVWRALARVALGFCQSPSGISFAVEPEALILPPEKADDPNIGPWKEGEPEYKITTQGAMNTAEIKARAEAATPGPWGAGKHGGIPWIASLPNLGIMEPVAQVVKSEADAEFIAHAREDVPALTAEVERLNKDIEDLKEAHANKASEWLAAQRKLTAIRKAAEPIIYWIEEAEYAISRGVKKDKITNSTFRVEVWFDVFRALAEALKEAP